MGRLQVLPANVANMIAAGEVVQRPSSVVKELMENAVDAGADRIDVIVTDAGRTLIQIIDNGCGMSPEDAVLCFERHATSKIASAEDLEGIITYGFRGEALASVAAVSEITLKTRREGDETGTQIDVRASEVVGCSQAAVPVGSNFAIRNLFFNTPARRKFLKSDNVELRHIIEEFTRVSIIRPDIAFSLTHNGREVFVLRKAKSLKFRVMDVLGQNVASDVVEIDTRTTQVNISGFVGKPDAARKALGNQFLFVNGRYFRSPYLHKAVMKAYEDLVPEGLTPSYILFLDVDPQTIDVNIHPTKSEVKFEDEQVIFQILYAGVKETLGRTSFRATIDFDTDGAVEMPQLGRSFEEYRGTSVAAPSPVTDPGYNPFEPQGGSRDPQRDARMTPNYDFGSAIDRRDDYGKLFEQDVMPTAQTLVIQGKYILTPSKSGLIAVNVPRAEERILFERTLRALGEEQPATQTALFPVQVRVGADRLPVLDDNAAMLSRLGFDIAPFGTDTVVVNGVPEGFSCEEGKVREMVEDLLPALEEDCGSLPEMMRSALAGRIASVGARHYEKVSSRQDAQRLLDALFECDNSEVTPGGRRIVSIITMDDLDKRF